MAGSQQHKKIIVLEVLPQGFKNSPTLFGKVLAEDLGDLELEQGTTLQYVDDILMTSPTKELSDHNTVNALNHLAERGYKVSKEKARISLQQVKYLGFIVGKGHRALSKRRKEVMCWMALRQEGSRAQPLKE